MRETLVTILATLLIGLTAAAWFAGNEIENQIPEDCWDIMECD